MKNLIIKFLFTFFIINALIFAQQKRMMFNKSVPCLEQYATVAWNFVETKKAISDTNIKVLYPDIYYQEISYSSDFGLESVISNVGGFVGIFLGYSVFLVSYFFWVSIWASGTLYEGEKEKYFPRKISIADKIVFQWF